MGQTSISSSSHMGRDTRGEITTRGTTAILIGTTSRDLLTRAITTHMRNLSRARC